MTEAKKYTAKQVESLLAKQRQACADNIKARVLTGFTAIKVILDTELVDVH